MLDFLDIKILDFVDIFLVALLLWQIYKAIRGTAAMSIFAGIFLVYIIWIVVKMLGMELLSSILGQVIGVGAIALLIVFQQEVRRYLLMLGNRWASNRSGLFKRIFASKSSTMDEHETNEIVEACLSMSANKTGALIVIERTTDTTVYAETGDRIDAVVSRRLVENIFFKNAPLHDGAIIIKDGRVAAARCVLPTSDNPNIAPTLGLRHRAAIGLSEHSDAMIIVVSEETGRISVVQNGTINRLDNPNDLIKYCKQVSL